MPRQQHPDLELVILRQKILMWPSGHRQSTCGLPATGVRSAARPARPDTNLLAMALILPR
jgi:hypothetical protein